MSLRTTHNTPEHQESFESTDYNRTHSKNASVVSQRQNANEHPKEEFTRNPLSQKHKTFTGVDSNGTLNRKTFEPDKYQMTTMAEKKMFMALALAEKFIQVHEYQRVIDQENSKKLHESRKKEFLLNSSSEWRSIEPISHEQLSQEESYDFLVKFRNQLKTFFRHNFINEIKKRRDKLSLIYKEEKLQSIEETEKESIRQSSFKNLEPTTFITADFTGTAMSDKFPQVDIMNLSSMALNFPKMNNLIKTNTMDLLKKQDSKFIPLKMAQSKSRLRIHPAKNKYQSRKKEEIRLFLQLDQKTEHLENFRSEEGKFFKFNQNLKVAIKNVNMCRIVLLSKRSAIMQQFGRLGDDNFFKIINENITSMENAILSTKQLKSVQETEKSTNSSKPKLTIPININKPVQPPQINTKNTQKPRENTKQKVHERFNSETGVQAKSIPRHSRKQSEAQPLNVYKEKALRIKNYIEETSKYFAQIQSFLIGFLKNDKGYENYKKENSLKEKISGFKVISEQERFYREFIDKCFHVSQISRLYFNALNQFAHQSVNLKEIKLLNKTQLDKENKRLIELRYALIYMQKECENTTESTFFNQTLGQGLFGRLNRTTTKNDGTNIQEPTTRTNPNTADGQLRSLLKNKEIMKTTVKTVLKENQNTLQPPASQDNQNSHKKPSSCTQIKSISKVTPVQNHLDRNKDNKITGIKRQSRQPRISTNSVKQEELDINLIWKTFYNKKFSSKAIRIRLY